MANCSIPRTALLPLLLAAVAVMGCSPSASRKEEAPARRLLLFCGAGLRPAAAELIEAFCAEQDASVDSDYAGQEVLLSKIRLAKEGDLFMPGESRYVDLAAEQNLILSRRTVCYFIPTILVQKGNPKRIARLADLLAPGIRLGLGDARSCAVGRLCPDIFEKHGIRWEEVEPKLAFQSATVNELAMQIQAGSLDAVIVWDATAKQYARHGDPVPIPLSQNTISTVDIAVLKSSAHPTLAKAFLELAASDVGRRIFQKHGYQVDPPQEDRGAATP